MFFLIYSSRGGFAEDSCTRQVPLAYRESLSKAKSYYFLFLFSSCNSSFLKTVPSLPTLSFSHQTASLNGMHHCCSKSPPKMMRQSRNRTTTLQFHCSKYNNQTRSQSQSANALDHHAKKCWRETSRNLKDQITPF